MSSLGAIAILSTVAALVVMCVLSTCKKTAKTDDVWGSRTSGRVVRGGRGDKNSFSWADVTAEDTAWFEKRHHRQVPPGIYASAPINQHLQAWCGVCWLVACVQVTQDKLNIREAPLEPTTRDHRAFVFNMQAAADDAAHLFSEEIQGRERSVGVLVARPRQWTACMGGEPKMALEALRSGSLRLAAQRLGQESWQSRSDPRRAGSVEGDAVVSGVRTIEPTVEAIKEELLRGPIVACTRSDPLWHLDEEGRTPAGSGERDHVMALIGWKTVGGEPCWIARNSWGGTPRSAVHAKPDDVRGCAGGLCTSETTEWVNPSSLPGFVFIPLDRRTNSMGLYDAPSGLFAVDV